jgi:pyrroloquinoline quinone (PQQ) biosynthesis protein C
MTDRAAIAAEYLRREAEANRRPEGADHAALMLSVGLMFGVTREEVRQAVLDHDGTGVG